jgi:SpoIID/LytB domain protein
MVFFFFPVGGEKGMSKDISYTKFTAYIENDAVAVHTKGFGHRVGMSQYGADAMARSGSDFAQIMHHYYQNVQLETDWYELTNP